MKECHDAGDWETLKISSNNIRSLAKNINELRDFALEESPSIMCLQEAWAPRINVNIDGYSYHLLKREVKKGGGLITYWKRAIQMTIIATETTDNFEYQLFRTTLENKSFLIVNVYLPPKGKKLQALEHLSKLIDLHQEGGELIIVGDFNINCLDKKADFNFIMDFMATHCLTQCTNEPTRLGTTKTKATAIDYILLGSGCNYKSHTIPTSHSDHVTLMLQLDSKIPKNPKPKPILKRSTNKKGIINLNNFLEKIDWNVMDRYSCTERKFGFFMEKITEALDKFCPFKEQMPHKMAANPWFSEELKTEKRKKEKFLRKALKSKTEEHVQKYHEQRRLYNKMVRHHKLEYYEREIEKNSKDSAASWKLFREILGKTNNKDKGYPSKFVEEGKILCHNKDIANGFNGFFRNIGNNLANNIKPSNKNFKKYLQRMKPVNSIFTFQKIAENDVERLIRSMKPKSSSSHDGMSNKLLKAIAHNIIAPLTKLINISLETGFIPDTWKRAKIVPLFKSGDNQTFSNYRPISLLPTMSKILEKAVNHQVVNYLEENNILFENQFGFRKGRTTEQACIKLLNMIADAKNKKKQTLAVFIDLKKAFDTVNIPILLEKLNYYGFVGPALSWFKNYLENRSQSVSFGGESSGLLNILMGVPQGSILGPLLFLLYINDLPCVLRLKSILFADDTLFSHQADSIDILYKEANDDLQIATDWFQANLLSLHPGKTRFIHFFPGHSSLPDLTIMGHKIQRIWEGGQETSFKYVGIHMDEGVNFKHHINHIKKKVLNTSFLINRSKRNLPIRARVMLYNGLIRPLLEYGINVYSSCCNSNLKPLETLQKKIIRVITGAKYNEPSDPLFQKMKLLNFKDLQLLNKLKMGYQVYHKQVPMTISEDFPHVNNQRLSRSSNVPMLDKPLYKTDLLQRMPKWSVPDTWNSWANSYWTDNSNKKTKNFGKFITSHILTINTSSTPS